MVKDSLGLHNRCLLLLRNSSSATPPTPPAPQTSTPTAVSLLASVSMRNKALDVALATLERGIIR